VRHGARPRSVTACGDPTDLAIKSSARRKCRPNYRPSDVRSAIGAVRAHLVERALEDRKVLVVEALKEQLRHLLHAALAKTGPSQHMPVLAGEEGFEPSIS
jgi:hypothetical protein